MCLWKVQYSSDELLASTPIVIQQLKIFRKQYRYSAVCGVSAYVHWAAATLSANRLNRFADRLLEAASVSLSVRPLVGQILLQLELMYLLPDRHLQMEYLQITATASMKPDTDITTFCDGHLDQFKKAHA